MNNGYHEESFKGYEIFVEENPDKYTGGYTWSISQDDKELDTGLSFDLDSAVSDAQVRINELIST